MVYIAFLSKKHPQHPITISQSSVFLKDTKTKTQAFGLYAVYNLQLASEQPRQNHCDNIHSGGSTHPPPGVLPQAGWLAANPIVALDADAEGRWRWKRGMPGSGGLRAPSLAPGTQQIGLGLYDWEAAGDAVLWWYGPPVTRSLSGYLGLPSQMPALTAKTQQEGQGQAREVLHTHRLLAMLKMSFYRACGPIALMLEVSLWMCALVRRAPSAGASPFVPSYPGSWIHA